MSDNGETAAYADKGALIGTGPHLPEEDLKVKITGPDGTPRLVLVRVRGLSRLEALDLEKLEASGTAMLERRVLSLAMVRPRMTEGDVRQWQERSAAGEIEPVTKTIEVLSGTGDGDAKEIYRRMAADPAEEFRVLPGDEARQDEG